MGAVIAPLLLGSLGRAVSFLQNRLGLPYTGVFDTKTDAALRAWQTKVSLKADGVYGPMSNMLMTSRKAADVKAAAASVGVELAAFAALLEVETAGTGFLDDGRPKILLERHYVYRLATQAQRDALTADLCYPTQGGYKGGTAEWERFEKVAAVSLDLAIQSCSWGLGQIMGANWKDIHENSPQGHMWGAATNEAAQLDQMAAFIVSKIGLVTALNAHDWKTVARIYNGPASVGYDVKLAAAFKA